MAILGILEPGSPACTFECRFQRAEAFAFFIWAIVIKSGLANSNDTAIFIFGHYLKLRVYITLNSRRYDFQSHIRMTYL